MRVSYALLLVCIGVLALCSVTVAASDDSSAVWNELPMEADYAEWIQPELIEAESEVEMEADKPKSTTAAAPAAATPTALVLPLLVVPLLLLLAPLFLHLSLLMMTSMRMQRSTSVRIHQLLLRLLVRRCWLLICAERRKRMRYPRQLRRRISNSSSRQ